MTFVIIPILFYNIAKAIWLLFNLQISIIYSIVNVLLFIVVFFLRFIVEKGVCAYYEAKDITANGDVFDDNEMTAAHRTLPFNTMVKVETMGTSVVVKINDRKTASDGQILLLSRAAAENMNIDEGTGPIPCQLKILTDVGCTPNLGNPCVMHHECCSRYCFREMFSEVGFCTPR